MQRDIVRIDECLGERFCAADSIQVPVLEKWVVGAYTQTERKCSRGHAAADPTHTNQRESTPLEAVHPPVKAPTAVAHRKRTWEETPFERQEKRDSVIRDLLDAVIRHIGHLNAMTVCRGDVDVVVPDAASSNYATPPRCGRGNDTLRDLRVDNHYRSG